MMKTAIACLLGTALFGQGAWAANYAAARAKWARQGFSERILKQFDATLRLGARPDFSVKEGPRRVDRLTLLGGVAAADQANALLVAEHTVSALDLAPSNLELAKKGLPAKLRVNKFKRAFWVNRDDKGNDFARATIELYTVPERSSDPERKRLIDYTETLHRTGGTIERE